MRRWLCAVGLLLVGCRRATPVSEPPALVATNVAQDGDGDGFVDGADRCPDAPGVAPHGCPEPDSDGDGFVDSKDACRDEVGVSPDGCPPRDSDGDGILDPDDGCPQAAETRNGFGDTDGCPDALPEDLAAITGPMQGLAFATNKDVIQRKSYPSLDRCVEVLARYPEVHVQIAAHTDSYVGREDYARSDLAGRRAAAVKRYLINFGVRAERLETQSFGPDMPIDTNKTAAGRAKNRRIEITILVR